MRFQDNFFDLEFDTMATIILKNLDFISQDSNNNNNNNVKHSTSRFLLDGLRTIL